MHIIKRYPDKIELSNIFKMDRSGIMNKKVWLIVSIAVIAGMMLQLPGFVSANETAEQAQVRVIHASPNSPAVDVYVNEDKILTGIKFKELSEYLALDEGSYEISLYEEGNKPKNSDPLLEGSVTAMAGESYTLAAGGKKEELTLYEFQDDREINEEEAKVRIIHLSPDAPEIDVYSLDTPLARGLSFPEASGYEPLAEGSYSVDIRPAGQEKAVFNIPNLELKKGESYTVIAVGLLKGDPAFDIVLAKDSE